MTKNNNKFYITTPIYYASGKPHLGHAYTSIAADIIARWNRDNNKEVFFQTGTDEHGQKIVEKASKLNKTPQEFVNFMVPQFKELLKRLNISYDNFIRTTDDNHKEFVQKMLQKSFDNSDIYKGSYKGLYCIDCERYYKEDELLENNICPDHKRKVEEIEEENYFFKLSKYQDKLLKFYQENPEFLSPKSKAQETINRVKEGLQDISISRNKNKLSWGIELPFDSSHVTYVWFDALFNYVSGCYNNDKKEFWPAQVHLIGKDIMWFHQVYWPAFLMSVGLELPKKVFSHGFILNNNDKMSKTVGNVIDPIKYSKKYGVDEFRFAILSMGSFGEDINFTDKLFINKINNDLNNDFGNLISRIHSMIEKYFNSIVPNKSNLEKEDLEFIKKLNIYKQFNEHLTNIEINKAIETLFTAIRDTNSYINSVSPWKITDKNRLATIMNVLFSSVLLFGKYINCIMPEKSSLIFKQFNYDIKNVKFTFELNKENIKLNQKENLFSKIETKKKENNNNSNSKKEKNNKNEEKKEGFSSLDLRVGKIIDIIEHPDSDKMFVETIDLGEEEPKTIVSGLKKYYKLEEMKNKNVIVLCNLKPAKLRGIKSSGMVLVSEKEDESELGLLLCDAKPGTHLEIENETANATSRIKSEKFFKMDFKSNGNQILFENKEVKTKNNNIKIDRNIKGIIC